MLNFLHLTSFFYFFAIGKQESGQDLLMCPKYPSNVLSCLLLVSFLSPFKSFWLCLLLVVLKFYMTIKVTPGSRLQLRIMIHSHIFCATTNRFLFWFTLLSPFKNLWLCSCFCRRENCQEGEMEAQSLINCDLRMMVNFQIFLCCQKRKLRALQDITIGFKV